MNTSNDRGDLLRMVSWLLRFGRALAPVSIALLCTTAPVTARASIINYNLDMTAQVSNYNNARYGDYITYRGQFTFDTTAGLVTSASITATGNLDYSDLSSGVLFNSVGRSQNSQVINLSSSSGFSTQFEFTNSLAAGQFDLGLNFPYSDVGDNFIYSAVEGSYYHIGYFGVTGGAAPIPEPISLILLGGSVIGLGLGRCFAARRLACT